MAGKALTTCADVDELREMPLKTRVFLWAFKAVFAASGAHSS